MYFHFLYIPVESCLFPWSRSRFGHGEKHWNVGKNLKQFKNAVRYGKSTT